MLHPNVRAILASSIHGNGLVAVAPIGAGEVVSRLDEGMPRMTIAAFLEKSQEEQDDISHYAYQISETELVFEGEPERFMNHSCDPNVWWADSYTMVARRDIAAGEELTYDYAMTEVDVPFAMDCRCGSPMCRKRVTNLDHLDAAWQARYGEHLPAHTLKAIGRAKAQPTG
jgi:hypothetical protein